MENFKRNEKAASIGGNGKEEMIETTAWGDEQYYPDNKETREAFKDVFNIPIFHHFVCDKYGNIEMEIFYERDARPYSFSALFPRFTNSNAKIRDCAHLYGFMWEQIGMLIYAYSEEEYWKFEKAFLEWIDKQN